MQYKIMKKLIFTILFGFASQAMLLTDPVAHFQELGVPATPLKEAYEYYLANQDILHNKRYMSVIDFSIKSSKKRFFIMDLETGDLQTEYVAHGSGRNRLGFPVSDLRNDGVLDRCMHSKFAKKIGLVPHRRWGMTRPGFIRVDGTYHSTKFAYGEYKKTKAANAILLTGLEDSSEDVRRNAVVIHEAWYVHDEGKIQGRTLGCPAVAPGRIATFMDKIKGGSLLYNYVPQCK